MHTAIASNCAYRRLPALKNQQGWVGGASESERESERDALTDDARVRARGDERELVWISRRRKLPAGDNERETTRHWSELSTNRDRPLEPRPREICARSIPARPENTRRETSSFIYPNALTCIWPLLKSYFYSKKADWYHCQHEYWFCVHILEVIRLQSIAINYHIHICIEIFFDFSHGAFKVIFIFKWTLVICLIWKVFQNNALLYCKYYVCSLNDLETELNFVKKLFYNILVGQLFRGFPIVTKAI